MDRIWDLIVRLIVGWNDIPPSSRVPFLVWRDFRSNVTLWAVCFVILGAVVILWAYAAWARQLRIHQPRDFFGFYWPMQTLWLSLLLPGLAVFLAYQWLHLWAFPDGPDATAPDALRPALVSLLLTLLPTYLLTWTRTLTPAQYKYRPRPMRIWVWLRELAREDEK